MKLSLNLPGWQRVVRVALGGGIAWVGIFFVKMPVLICVLVLAGVVAATGFVGFCPICRVLKSGPS